MLPSTLPYGNDFTLDGIDITSTALQTTASQTPTPKPPEYDRSVLTQVQKDRLYRASLSYLADNDEEAVYVARNIEYVPNEGHPATMCGPLAMSILRDAMLVDRYINVGDFWLLNPREDYTVHAILEKYFPREHYHWYQTTTPVNYYDFKSHPLYTGDFLYLFAGRGGTFEHMLVVTRVDDMGRAYSVFAVEDSSGYSIEEVMLYDPNNPGEGYFYEITDSTNAGFGITGLGGFWMWRRITPFPEVNFDDLAFSDRLDSILNETGGEWHVYIKEVEGRVIYSRESQEVVNPASIIKVPLAIQFFQALNYQQNIDLNEYLSTHGVKGRTYMQLLTAMLVDSEEDATELLLDWVGDRIHIKDTFSRWGALETTYLPRRTTAEEISNIFEGLYKGLWLLPEERQIILDLMGSYSSGDDTRLGLINEYLPDDYNLYNKRGSVAKGFVVVADIAIIDLENTAYIVAMFGYPESGGKLPTYDDLEATIEETVPLIWYYLNQ
jgi:beta-lactamase class A